MRGPGLPSKVVPKGSPLMAHVPVQMRFAHSAVRLYSSFFCFARCFAESIG
jgi:hypothetical protein